jgi:hypothetical protein
VLQAGDELRYPLAVALVLCAEDLAEEALLGADLHRSDEDAD